jgi:hypothetical protein
MDQLLKDAKGENRISVANYAMAMIDEVEKPNHICRRFTEGVPMIGQTSVIASPPAHVDAIERKARLHGAGRP